MIYLTSSCSLYEKLKAAKYVSRLLEYNYAQYNTRRNLSFILMKTSVLTCRLKVFSDASLRQSSCFLPQLYMHMHSMKIMCRCIYIYILYSILPALKNVRLSLYEQINFEATMIKVTITIKFQISEILHRDSVNKLCLCF